FADELATALAPVRVVSLLLGILAMVALTLAMTGLFVVVSYVVTQRTFEIGVRVALGATRLAIVRMILGDALRVVAFGCVVGGLCAWVIARAVQALIVAQPVMTPLVFPLVASLLVMIGLVASLSPARRAASTDPIKALRHD